MAATSSESLALFVIQMKMDFDTQINKLKEELQKEKDTRYEFQTMIEEQGKINSQLKLEMKKVQQQYEMALSSVNDIIKTKHSELETKLVGMLAPKPEPKPKPAPEPKPSLLSKPSILWGSISNPPPISPPLAFNSADAAQSLIQVISHK